MALCTSLSSLISLNLHDQLTLCSLWQRLWQTNKELSIPVVRENSINLVTIIVCHIVLSVNLLRFETLNDDSAILSNRSCVVLEVLHRELILFCQTPVPEDNLHTLNLLGLWIWNETDDLNFDVVKVYLVGKSLGQVKGDRISTNLRISCCGNPTCIK